MLHNFYKTTSILLRKEKLKRHELYTPLITTILILGALNSIFRFNEITQQASALLVYLSIAIGFILIPPFDWLVKIRVNRLYNSILWFIPSVILFILYYWITVHQELEKNIHPVLISALKFPLLILLSRHLMRIIHILLFKTEPLSIAYLIGPLIIDDEARWEEISTDKGFTILQSVVYLIILAYVLGLLYI